MTKPPDGAAAPILNGQRRAPKLCRQQPRCRPGPSACPRERPSRYQPIDRSRSATVRAHGAELQGGRERPGRLASASCHALSLRRTRTMVGMRGRIGGLVCAGALLLAGEAKAAPRALLDAPRATAVALAGSEILVGRPASRGAARIDAVPIGGGPVRAVARMPRPRPGQLGRPVVIASSAQLVAAVVEFYGERPIPARTQLWIGPPA